MMVHRTWKPREGRYPSASMRRWLQRIRIPILYYHEIGTVPGKHVVHPADFEAQLDWLVEAGFEALSMDELVAIHAGHRPAPARAVLLSFDDGRAGVRDFAAPALARRGLPAILYLVTGWLDGAPIPESERYSQFVGWSDLAALQRAGFSLGSHTVSHRNLKRIPPPEVEREVRDSRLRLEEKLGCAVEHFSFPYGRRTRAVERAVRAAGYRTAVVTGERSNGRFARLHRLFRLRVDGRESLAAFQARLVSVS
jgi:peptidoglycan/xylan/chitin deacetylase (PgdA/CDA1 family)